MIKRKVALVLFYDNKGNILVQDRREKSRIGEEYGFFGGQIEEGETPKQALKREIKEELGINIKNFEYFKKLKQIIKEADLYLERIVFISKMPNIKNIKVGEGKPIIIKFEDSFNLKFVPGDIDLIKEIYEFLKNKNRTF